MRPARTLLVLLVALASVTPAAAQLWNPFRSREARDEQVQPASHQAPLEGDYRLAQTSGPWLIMATTFSGEGAEEQARQLADELSSDHGLRTYVHQMKFDFTEGQETVGRGVDKYGAPIKMRYRSGEERREWAVLVGDFPSVDDPIASKTLSTIKAIEPQTLALGADGETHQNFAHIREAQEAALRAMGRTPAAEGPMRSAFLTRNPVLPREYFVPKGVDPFVAKMNKGLDHALLEAPGRYTVRVATFRGRGLLQGATTARSTASRRAKRDREPLAEAAQNAHFLCLALRERGWEAYEFHDRDESCVTVGSFDAVDKQGTGAPIEQIRSLADARTEVVEIFRTFGAEFETSPTPLERDRAPLTESARAKEVKQTFNQLFASEVGQVASGLNPKYAMVKIEAEEGQPTRPVPFDVRPQVIEAPRKTVSGAFAWRR